MGILVDGVEVATDAEGYLLRLEDWSREVAEAMAAADGVELSAGHWEVIGVLRGYYERYQVAPGVRIFTKAIGREMGMDKANSRYLYELFPHGVKQVCRYAGLAKPSGCI